MRHEESRIQQMCIKWLRLQFPKLDMLCFAVPNGGFRNGREAAILKAEGVVAGVADILLLFPSGDYHGLAIEMKTANGRQQASQKRFQKAVEGCGYKYVVCRSFEQFREAILEYLNIPENCLTKPK